MKKALLSFLSLGIVVVASSQSGCSSYSLNSGDSLVFTRLLPPPYDPALMKLKPKERVEYLKKQSEDINSGKLKLREGKASFTVNSKEPTATGFIAKAQLAVINPPNRYLVPYVYECLNDTLFVSPEQPFSEMENVGVNYTGTVVYPLKMKVGDLLPDNKNVLVTYKRTGSDKFLMPYISKVTTTHYVDRYGTELYKTIDNTWSNKEVTNNFSNITTMETTYANREVTGDTTISYKGKTYKGFIIKCYLLPSTSVEVTADYFQKSMQKLVNRQMAKAARKLAEDESGVYTTLIQEVFVPELAIVSTQMTKKDGSFFSKTILSE